MNTLTRIKNTCAYAYFYSMFVTLFVFYCCMIDDKVSYRRGSFCLDGNMMDTCMLCKSKVRYCAKNSFVLCSAVSGGSFLLR